jgi:hypothetical protein
VIDQYTQKDIYDYVLELDAAGKIIGGEWIGASRQNHPDFLWLPVKKNSGTVAGVISYADVKQLFTLANGALPAPAPTVLVHDASTLAADAWKHYGPFKVDAPGLVAALAIAKGDGDLYLRKDAKPTTSAYDCRPYEDGLTAEKCDLGAGNWYVARARLRGQHRLHPRRDPQVDPGLASAGPVGYGVRGAVVVHPLAAT